MALTAETSLPYISIIWDNRLPCVRIPSCAAAIAILWASMSRSTASDSICRAIRGTLGLLECANVSNPIATAAMILPNEPREA